MRAGQGAILKDGTIGGGRIFGALLEKNQTYGCVAGGGIFPGGFW
jgi:hypothetical protein